MCSTGCLRSVLRWGLLGMFDKGNCESDGWDIGIVAVLVISVFCVMCEYTIFMSFMAGSWVIDILLVAVWYNC